MKIDLNIVHPRPWIRLLAYGPNQSELAKLVYSMPRPIVAVDAYGHASYLAAGQEETSVLHTTRLDWIHALIKQIAEGERPCTTFVIHGLSAVQDVLKVQNAGQGFQCSTLTRGSLVTLMEAIGNLGAHVVLTANSKDEYAATGTTLGGQLVGPSDKIVVGTKPEIDAAVGARCTIIARIQDERACIDDSFYKQLERKTSYDATPETFLAPVAAAQIPPAKSPEAAKAALPAPAAPAKAPAEATAQTAKPAASTAEHAPAASIQLPATSAATLIFGSKDHLTALCEAYHSKRVERGETNDKFHIGTVMQELKLWDGKLQMTVNEMVATAFTLEELLLSHRIILPAVKRPEGEQATPPAEKSEKKPAKYGAPVHV